MAKTLRRSKKTRRIVTNAIVTVVAGFNNTHITYSDSDWKVLVSVSAWEAWFKWAREATPYAAQTTAELATEKVKNLHSVEEVTVYVKWIGVWRELALRWLVNGGMDISAVYDVTPIPHNGCRKKKVRKL